MNDPLRAIVASEGVFLYGEAIQAGYKDSHIRHMRQTGEWVRIRHGVYCFGDDWQRQSANERHLTRIRAVLRTTPGPVVLSHVSSLVVQGIDTWGADLDVVDVTRLDSGASRSEAGVRHHVGVLDDDDLVQVGDFLVTAPARAVVESSTVLPVESGIVSANSALHQGRCTEDEVRAFFGRVNNWPNSQRTHLVLHHMDGRAETVGESRSTYLFWQQGLPLPDLQRDVYDGGRLVATTDFAWDEYKLFGEFDGKEKYLRYLRPGESPGDAVFREKKREDLIRRLTGWRFIRLTWADLYVPERTAAYIRGYMRTAA
jgi:hypothetical protein